MKIISFPSCPKCGIIEKSGKISCCGRGGSWFRNCGSAGNTKLHHTWYEGIQACKTRPQQSKTVIARQQGINSPHADDMTNYNEVVGVFALTAVNTSTAMSHKTSMMTSIYTSDKMSLMVSSSTNHHTSVVTLIITQGCETSTFTSIFYLPLYFSVSLLT